MTRLQKELNKNKYLLAWWRKKTGYKGKRKTVVYRQILEFCGNKYNKNKSC